MKTKQKNIDQLDKYNLSVLPRLYEKMTFWPSQNNNDIKCLFRIRQRSEVLRQLKTISEMFIGQHLIYWD